ncbi:Breast cancer type 1 susceptibility protein-like protein [Operophtera brumata]|uniref:Breast cancer type 1 susceptibility protein-like protein n=1 Tax=Operophtera brumata TaxID=104452 RepID=A0A0L7LM49_OPEBR|nr:Breast cancer type 1 susceptibility protein-like protein [Operophtera brumata]
MKYPSCNHYIAPATAPCGHTLCHKCWRGRRSCPVCTAPVQRGQIKLNQPLQKLTEHVQSFWESFDKHFNIKCKYLFGFAVNECLLDFGEPESENDPAKIVKDWLASSQNNFSVPAQSSDPSSLDLIQNYEQLEKSSSKIQVHTTTRKTISPERVARVSTSQGDWDKIEVMEETEVVEKNKENIRGPMDIEPFNIDDTEYTTNHPRRSLRKRQVNNNDALFNTDNSSFLEKENPKDASSEMVKKSNKIKQNWNNVKKMRKEFNKINRSKLNVSFEMCKKTQSTVKPNAVLQKANTPTVYEIDENTPKLPLTDLPDIEMDKVVLFASSNNIDNDVISSEQTEKDNLQNSKCTANENIQNQSTRIMSQSVLDNAEQSSIPIDQVKTYIENNQTASEKRVRMPFYKKSALCTSAVVQNSDQVQKEKEEIKTVNHNIESNEDVVITIKVGNTTTNIVISKKNDVQLNVKTDKEVQTSCSLQNDANISPPQEMEKRSISIKTNSNNSIKIEHKQITDEFKKQVNIDIPIVPEIKNQASSLKSAKKNTASADTGTGQYEITESVEKELSSIMAYAEIEEPLKTKSVPIPEKISQKVITAAPRSNPEKTSQIKYTPKPQLDPENIPLKVLVTNSQTIPMDQDDLEYLNDLDIFESDTVKETNVQLLKYANNTTPSEILISTAHNRNKTQKTYEKRGIDVNDENLPTSKKQKLNTKDKKRDENPTADLAKQSKTIQPDSESMNYDSIMDQVFASIDADMEQIKSQNVLSQKLPDNKTVTVTEDKPTQNAKTHNAVEHNQGDMAGKCAVDCTLNSNDSCVYVEEDVIEETSAPKKDKVPPTEPQPDIEYSNDFCASVEEEDVIEATSAPKTDEVPPIEPHPNIEDFLTPVMSKNQESSSVALENEVMEIENDDSEGVVEATPQKATSFGNKKQKSIGASKELDSSKINLTEPRLPSGKSESASNKTVVNRVDVSDVTVINVDTRLTLETPLTIGKFVNRIKHNSTPLNFNTEDSDPEQTLCPTDDAVAKTTQEKEFMRKAFERTPTQVVKPLPNVNKRFCITGSCLSASETAKLKALCCRYKWTYEKYEALDGSTGDPSPRRSRVATTKLFQGITFYCMAPFSDMLEESGGRVVSEAQYVSVTETSRAPALLLAEPEHTQEDRFICKYNAARSARR